MSIVPTEEEYLFVSLLAAKVSINHCRKTEKSEIMKKILSTLLFVMASWAAFSQSGSSNVHFGLKASPSLAWLRTDSKYFESNGSKFGFTYGLITEFGFTERYAFATGLDISYRGGKLKSIITSKNPTGGDSTTSIQSSLTLQYIELPLTIKLKTNEIGYLTYYLQAGIAPGLNIRSRINSKITSESNNNGVITNASSEDNNVDIKKDINTLNLSMLIGGGVEYTLSGSTVLLVGLQFNNGFIDVYDGNDLKANSNFLALTLGILF